MLEEQGLLREDFSSLLNENSIRSANRKNSASQGINSLHFSIQMKTNNKHVSEDYWRRKVNQNTTSLLYENPIRNAYKKKEVAKFFFFVPV